MASAKDVVGGSARVGVVLMDQLISIAPLMRPNRQSTSAFCQTRCGHRQALPPRGVKATAYGQQKCRSSDRCESHEDRGEALALHQTPAGEVLGQHSRAGPRRIKPLVRPGLGFKSLISVFRTIAGYEALAMIRKGHVASVPASIMQAQADFIAALSSVTA